MGLSGSGVEIVQAHTHPVSLFFIEDRIDGHSSKRPPFYLGGPLETWSLDPGIGSLDFLLDCNYTIILLTKRTRRLDRSK
ncbi:hypothetical protein M0802_012877 [Mischocyttarus mexicanus]|nr:hypothetical protein M0802_012877 [Mischocyttarus mexicanus]